MTDQSKGLELRMYFFVPYNISPIQQGIQAGHALGRYALKYGRHDPKHIVWNFLEKWETFVILNGGTTNDQRDFEAIPAGSLNVIGDQLRDNDIEFSYMIEPDLNRALSALAFIADERVFNYRDYPDFIDWYIENHRLFISSKEIIELRMTPIEEQVTFNYYTDWVELMGGEKNLFLRELIRGKKLA